MKQLYYIGASMRPKQWTKNLVVFAGLITLIVTLYDRYRPIHVARFASHDE